MHPNLSTPAPDLGDFLEIPGPFGHPVLVHRLQAEQSAASGMPVLLAIPVDAVRLALAGRSLDPRERFSELDNYIADAIADHGPGTAAEIAARVKSDHDHITNPAGVRDRFRKGRPLRDAGYTTTGDGYAAPM